jgi:MerR family transcriptional regulator, repressor of the yfmOP operon
MVMNKAYYQIDEVAEKTGLTKRTLRYYEELGIISPIRKESKYRLYSDEDIEMLKNIRDTKNILGFSMSDLKAFSEIEKKVMSVFRGEIQEEYSIQLYKEESKRLLQLVEEKEKILLQVKTRLNRALEKLSNMSN